MTDSEQHGGEDAYVRYSDWLTIGWLFIALGALTMLVGYDWYMADMVVTSAENVAPGTLHIEFDTAGPGWILGPLVGVIGFLLVFAGWQAREYAASINPCNAEVLA